MKNFMEKVKGFKSVALALIITVMSVPMAFADSSATTTALTAGAESIKTDLVSTTGAVGPIAIGILGLFMVWKLGIKFFKSTTNASS